MIGVIRQAARHRGRWLTVWHWRARDGIVAGRINILKLRRAATCGAMFFALSFSRRSKRRTSWLGRRPFWLKSASVSKSMATCQLTATCRPNSNFPFWTCRSSERSRPASVRVFIWHRGGLRAHVSGKRNRKKCLVIPGDGDPCPRCRQPMQIREYDAIDEQQLRQPSFYTRWFCCMNIRPPWWCPHAKGGLVGSGIDGGLQRGRS